MTFLLPAGVLRTMLPVWGMSSAIAHDPFCFSAKAGEQERDLLQPSSCLGVHVLKPLIGEENNATIGRETRAARASGVDQYPVASHQDRPRRVLTYVWAY